MRAELSRWHYRGAYALLAIYADLDEAITEGERIARAWERRHKVVDLECARERLLKEGREP